MAGEVGECFLAVAVVVGDEDVGVVVIDGEVEWCFAEVGEPYGVAVDEAIASFFDELFDVFVG